MPPPGHWLILGLANSFTFKLLHGVATGQVSLDVVLEMNRVLGEPVAEQAYTKADQLLCDLVCEVVDEAELRDTYQQAIESLRVTR